VSDLLTPVLCSGTILEQDVDNKQRCLLIREAMMTIQHNTATDAVPALHRPNPLRRLLHHFSMPVDERAGGNGQVIAGSRNDEPVTLPAAKGRLIVGCRPYVFWQ
jgi:hypothetical protein